MPKATETTLEINLSALGNNYRFLASKLKSTTKVLAVVKAYGYGSDAIAVAQELEALGAAYFAVAYAKEGANLRDGAIQTPILVLHPLPENFELILHRCLEPSIYSFKMLKEFIAFAEAHGQKNYPIHLKFNTGLNRLGFTPDDTNDIAEILKLSTSVKVASIFSHLAASEDPKERLFTEKQLTHFAKISEAMTTLLGYKPILHTLNTSGILNYPDAQYDMVRTGIGLYGYGNDPRFAQFLQPVATLKTVISQIHTLNVGDTLGYNRALTASAPMKTATLPIGHADGISRLYGNGKGAVWIHNKKAPIVGNVCMDMIMVDVTNIVCDESDEVIIFNTQHTADDLSSTIHSITYEILTAVSQRVKRVITRE